MKPSHLLATLAFGLSNAALHGVVVAEAKDIDFELVAKPDSLRLYARARPQ